MLGEYNMMIIKKQDCVLAWSCFFAGVIFLMEARIGYLSIGLISFSINFLFPPAF